MKSAMYVLICFCIAGCGQSEQKGFSGNEKILSVPLAAKALTNDEVREWRSPEREKAMQSALKHAQRLQDEAAVTPPKKMFKLPNYEGGAGHPLPLNRNYYESRSSYPGYLLCSFDIEEHNANSISEPKWFVFSIQQIRDLGEKAFPPTEWVAIVIVNRIRNTTDNYQSLGAIFKASKIFDASLSVEDIVKHASMDTQPFEYDNLQASPAEKDRWRIIERHQNELK